MFNFIKRIFKKKDRSTNDLITSKSSQNMYISVMYGSFVAATLISAVINVTMFSQLSILIYEQILCVAISITLEGTKVLSIFKSSVLMNIGKKIDIINHRNHVPEKKNVFGRKVDNSATKAGKFYFKLYLAFAFIAIFASIGLTLTMTSRVSASTNTERTKISTTQSNAETDKASLEKKLADLGFTDIKKKYDDAVSQNETYALKVADLTAAIKTNPNDKSNATELARVRAYQKALGLDAKKAAYDQAFAVKQDLDNKIAADEKIIGDSKVSAVDVQGQQEKDQGTSNMFALIASTVRVVSEIVLKFVVLMLMSLLIEVTVYTAAPEININRKILYYFRKYLPEDLDIDALLEEFDKDVSRFKDQAPIAPVPVAQETPVTQEAAMVELPQVPKVEAQGPEPVAQVPVLQKGKTTKSKKKKLTKKAKAKSVPSPISQGDEPIQVASKEAAKEMIPEAQSSDLTETKTDEANPQDPGITEPTLDNAETATEVPVPEATERPSEDSDNAETPAASAQSETAASVTEDDQGGTDAGVSDDKAAAERALAEEKAQILKRRLPKAQAEARVEQEQEQEQEQEPESEPKQEPSTISKVTANVVNYRFGKTTEQVKDLLVKYIRGLMAGLDDTSEYPAGIKDPAKVAKDLHIPEQISRVLLTRLTTMKYGETPLIRENPDGSYVTNFNPVFLEDWTTAERP